MEKKKYFVNIGTREISQIPVGDNNDFTIYATEDEVFLLREKFEEMHDADKKAFWRAHVPIVPYHNDQPNDDYDADIVSALKLLYKYGDQATKQHITSMGIIDLE